MLAARAPLALKARSSSLDLCLADVILRVYLVVYRRERKKGSDTRDRANGIFLFSVYVMLFVVVISFIRKSECIQIYR